jgi:hypothetical protein
MTYKMSYAEAAFIVLKDAGRTMHQREIYDEVVRRQLWLSHAQPHNVDRSTYGTLIKAFQAEFPYLGRDANNKSFFFYDESRG